MKNLSAIVVTVILLFGTGMTAVAQSVGKYVITRETGISYSSISSSGNSVGSWRHNDPTQMLDGRLMIRLVIVLPRPAKVPMKP